MSHRVRLSSVAQRDLARLEDFLSEKAPTAAARAAAAIRKATMSLRRFPDRGHPYTIPGVRELPVPFGSSGYIIRYIIASDEVTVLRIFHSLEER